MKIYELPVIDVPYQRLKTFLNGVDVALSLNWNDWLGRWSLDVEIDDETRVAGLRLVPGTDLVAGFNLGIGRLVLVDWAGRGGNPGRADLPSGTFRLISMA